MSEIKDILENKFLQFQATDPSYSKEQFVQDCKNTLREKLQQNVIATLKKMETSDLVDYLKQQKDIEIEDGKKQERESVQLETRPEARGKRAIRKES